MMLLCCDVVLLCFFFLLRSFVCLSKQVLCSAVVGFRSKRVFCNNIWICAATDSHADHDHC